MSGVNKVIILGRLGRDPELRYMPNGTAVCKINVATSERWIDKNSNEKIERTEWHRISFFGKVAEVINKHFEKGSQIYVEGKMRTSSYEKDGIKMWATEIIASSFDFIGKSATKSDSQSSSQSQSQQDQSFDNYAPDDSGPSDVADDDIPF